MLRQSALVLLLTLAATAHELPFKLWLNRALDSQVANIHLNHAGTPNLHGIAVTYGPCSATSPSETHHRITTIQTTIPDRLVWHVPDSIQPDGCLSAWDKNDILISISPPVQINLPRLSKQIHRRGLLKRQQPPNIEMTSSNGIDTRGPWFDGVAALQTSSISSVNITTAKSKQIAIVGGGMAGLMTWLILDDAGFSNITILESTNELGGRIQTKYFGDPCDRQYQEMGPMRFPQAIQYAETNETVPIKDHQIVTDLITHLNRRNRDDHPKYNLSMIPFINSSPNGIVYRNDIRKPDGHLPTVLDLQLDPSLIPSPPPLPGEVIEINAQLTSLLANETLISLLARNIFAAYKEWQDHGLDGLGGDSWSEFSYVHNYLNHSLGATFIASASSGFGGFSFWDRLYETFYFGATAWLTIDGGLQRMPNAFLPHVRDATIFNAKVDGVSYSNVTNRVTISHRDPLNPDFSHPPQSQSFDLAVLTPPLSMLRTLSLPSFSPLLATAIQSYTYSRGCKCALQFSSRFWEHLPLPIYGPCSTTTSTKGIGQICYPSYDINSTGPGVVIGSYTASADALRWVAVDEAEYVNYTLASLAQIHGSDVVYGAYTGNASTKCWLRDLNSYAGWAQPDAGQRAAFGPAFFKTEQGCVIAGEATSFTSSWIASALESGVRAGVQVLLGEGLVDEAKMAVETWMARWIEV